MRKLIVLGLLTLLAMSGFALAAPGHKGAPEFVPQLTEDKLTKIVFIRYVPGFAKACDYDGVCEPEEGENPSCADCKKSNGEEPPEEPSGCYDFLAGPKPRWNSIEDYHYSTSELGTASELATETWNAATSATIFGTGVSESLPWGVYDYKNAISYGNYPEPNVIAVAAIWFQGKNIYEYDIMFDTDYAFGDATIDPEVIDLDTVTLHEFGHGAGLGDLYDSVCSEEVMYGIYAGVKSELQNGDKTGIQTLYGA